MTATRSRVVAMMALGALLSGSGSAEESLNPKLEPLRAFVGKTYRGEFSSATKEKPAIDVQRWERALNGQAIRIMHSLNDGEYGGETLVFWDEPRKSIVYYYFTTEGFFTHGSFQVAESGYTAHEVVDGDANGITEVRSTARVLEDSQVRVQSEYRKDGEWAAGHEVTYIEAPDATVVLR